MRKKNGRNHHSISYPQGKKERKKEKRVDVGKKKAKVQKSDKMFNLEN